MQSFHPLQSQSAQPMNFDLISRTELQRLCYDEGLSDAQIAQRFNVTANQVNRKRRQMNLVQGEVSAEQLAEIVRLAESVKALPLEAIEEVRSVVQRYTH